uniref:Secreted protein n=1 Tax=Anopheles melas TaxID=34690 RepID=A0A182TZ27_9DIPT
MFLFWLFTTDRLLHTSAQSHGSQRGKPSSSAGLTPPFGLPTVTPPAPALTLLLLRSPVPSLVVLLELEDEELELLELSDATPVLWPRSVSDAILARSGSTACSTFSHLLDSFGRPRTVLCHTTGKLVRLQKFCVTATVSSRLSTTCHQPPGTNTVSPGFCKISSWKRGRGKHD